jgi:hypothetical protein
MVCKYFVKYFQIILNQKNYKYLRKVNFSVILTNELMHDAPCFEGVLLIVMYLVYIRCNSG